MPVVQAMQVALAKVGMKMPDWPEWAVNTFAGLSCACCVLLLVMRFDTASTGSSEAADVGGKQAPAFRRFQLKYLTAYLIIMLADWLQGTNMYTLYQSYGVSVGTLFLTGFSSSAVFGTFLGLFVDRYGRRLGCLVFCVLEIIINTLEHYPAMHLLLLGRVLGGISTSLLFTAFESWMVSEHRKRGFPEAWLASTFSLSTVGNGIVAILAGIIAQVAADKLGEIGPFQVAIALTALTLVLLLFWEENYGRADTCSSTSSDSKAEAAAVAAAVNGIESTSNGSSAAAHKHHDSEEQSFRASVASAWHCITADGRVLLLGLIQSLFEGAMYTFVFMWVPTLLALAPNGKLPTGLVFSSFMVCVTIGGALSAAMLRRVTVEAGSCAVFAAAAAAMALPAVSHSFYPVLCSFLLLETCVGAFYACAGVMRSRYLPDAQQGAIMNIFRLPLNVLVVVGTRLTDAAPPTTVFTVVSLWFAAAALLQYRLYCMSDAPAAAVSSASKKEL
jgi:MFS transporter, MFS domain-containing protein family, molybdate-anion transporter